MQVLKLKSGNALHYSDEGPRDGVAVLFSNSLGTDFRAWDPLLPHLPQGVRVIRYDKAGHGLSDFAGERPISAHAGDALELLDHLGVERAVVVGLSVGGLIAQAMHDLQPQRIAGMALCDTGHRIGNADMWNDRIAKIEAGGVAALADPILERWFTAKFRAEAPDFPAWRNMLVRTSGEGYCAVGRAIRDADYTAQTAAIEVPTVCIVGAEDGATPPALVKELSGLIAGAIFVEIPDCGHLPCVEQPAALAGHLKALLARVSGV